MSTRSTSTPSAFGRLDTIHTMARACIYTLEPLEHGGVMAKVRVVLKLLREALVDVNLLYTATEQVPTGSRREVIRYFMGHARAQWIDGDGYRGYAIPHWPLPLWATYALPWIVGRPAFADRDVHVVVSGANQCGFPATLARKRYIVWIGTLYRDELEAKARAGDPWAQRTLTNLHGRLLQAQERAVFERAALILTNGSHAADRIRATWPHLAGKTRVAIYPVDMEVFCPSSSPVDGDRESPYLLFTARINDVRKNVGMLFRTFRRVRTEFPSVRLVLTGDAPDADVREQLHAAGVADGVDFTGRLARPELVELYRGAELFVLSSNQEGLGISMLEALACGVPVVATRCGGPESIVIDGETGYLVPPDDDRAMAERIAELLANRQLRDRMRTACRAYAESTFSRAAVEEILLQAFKDVYPEHFGYANDVG